MARSRKNSFLVMPSFAASESMMATVSSGNLYGPTGTVSFPNGEVTPVLLNNASLNVLP